MKNIKLFFLALASVAGAAVVLSGLSMPSLAFPSSITASPGNAATPDWADIPLDYDLENRSSDAGYTICEYVFRYYDFPLLWNISDEFHAEEKLPQEIEVYFDGPDGHIEDCITMGVIWDISSVDFTSLGNYTITGTLDTSVCPYPVDWEQTPPPSLTIQVVSGGALSFQVDTNEDILNLSFILDGEPYSDWFSSWTTLYESTDGGNTWVNITYSRRVNIYNGSAVISGITGDCLYQFTDLGLDGFYAENSDILSVTADNQITTVEIIPSGGIQGGSSWGEEQGCTWLSDPVMDGPYPILGYKTIFPRFQPLQAMVQVGNPDEFQEDYYKELHVYYGNEPDGFWSEWIDLPVVWDFSLLDTIDWDQPGDTVIYGSFDQETIDSYRHLLDFDRMADLALTISVYTPKEGFLLYEREEVPFENQTAHFYFVNSYSEEMQFEDISGVKIWCSVDGEKNWYDITDFPNVALKQSSMSISALKDVYLRNYGYSFQIEQQSHSEYYTFSTVINVYHDIWGIGFTFGSVSGDRGGGQRHNKPPKGLFDIEEPEETPSAPPTEAPEETAPARPGPGNSSSKDDSYGSYTSLAALPTTSPALVPVVPTAAISFQAEEETTVDNHGLQQKETPAGKYAAEPEAEPVHESAVPAPSETEASLEASVAPENIKGPSPEAETNPAAAAAPAEAAQAPAPFYPIRVIICISAVMAGGIAGFFMIRRR